jgi:WD40 repeat protein
MRPLVVFLLFAGTASAADLPAGALVRIPGPALWLPRSSLHLTPDGKHITDGRTWIDLKTEKRVEGWSCLALRKVFDDIATRKWASRVVKFDVNGEDRFAVEIALMPKLRDEEPNWRRVAVSLLPVDDLTFNADDGHLLWSEVDPANDHRQTVRVCPLAGGAVVTLDLDWDAADESIRRAALSADGKLAAVLTFKRFVLADAATGKVIRSDALLDSEKGLRNLYNARPPLFTPDGKYAVLPELTPRRIDLFPLDPKADRRHFDLPECHGVISLAVTPDSKRAVVQDDTGTVRVYDLATGKRADRGGGRIAWQQVRWLGDGRFATWTHNGFVCVWDSATGKPVREFDVGPLSKEPTFAVLRFSPTGKHVLAWESAGHPSSDTRHRYSRVRVYDVATGQRTLALPEYLSAFEAAFHPDGKTVAVGTDDRRDKESGGEGDWRRTYDLATGEPVTANKGGDLGVFCFAGDGRSLISFDGSEGQLSLSWIEAGTGDTRWSRPVPARTKWDRALDGSEYLLAVDDAAGQFVFRGNLYDLLTGNEKPLPRPLPGGVRTWGHDWSVNGRWMFGRVCRDADENTVEYGLALVDLRQKPDDPAGKSFVSMSLAESPTATAVSDDGTRGVTVSADGTITVWDLDRLRKLAPKVEAKSDLWKRLGEDDHVEAMRALHADPAAVQLLAAKLPPVAQVDADRVTRWIQELGSADFKTREAAEKELAAVADAIRPALRAAAKSSVGAEPGERLERLRATLDELRGLPDHRRMVRAVEIAERIGTPEAVKLLDRWAGGAAEAALTAEAAGSLARARARR